MNYVIIFYILIEKIIGNFFNFVSYIIIDSNYNKLKFKNILICL